MGNYNPNLPVILGMEFVPIVDRIYDIDLGTEFGYGFSITGLPANAVNEATEIMIPPSSAIAGQTVFYSVYPRGREDDTGEIRTFRMVVQSIAVTGAVVSGSGGTATLDNPADNQSIVFDSVNDRLRVTIGDATFFTGKRILGVDLIYQAAGTPGFTLEPSIESHTVRYPYGPFITGPPELSQVSELGVVRFGDVNPWWSTAAGPNTEAGRMPWRADDMARFSLLGTGGQLFIGIRPTSLPASGVARLGFLAMDVYYCDESRVVYGGYTFGQDPSGALTFGDVSNPPIVPLRTPAFVLGATLAVGAYSVTVTQADAGDKYNTGDRIKLGRVHQYRDGVRTHPAIRVDKFKRPSGGRPTIPPLSVATDEMTGIGLRSSGTTLQNGEAPFTYVEIQGAPVYINSAGASTSAIQPIHNEANPADTTYEQVRFYARRFNPTAPGDLTVSVAGSGSATITPTAFAALDELVIGANGPGTGWKEVTLPITAVFSSDATFRDVTFTMTGVATGNIIDQWQVLVSRIRLQEVGLIPGAFTESRYDGLQRPLTTWQSPERPNFMDTYTDTTVIVMFSQDSPAPTGLTITQMSQSITGVGLGCAGVPACIPTGLSYNNVTWRFNLCGSSSPAVTGGHLELQRMDTVDSVWQTIAVTSICTTGVADYEARVGVLSSYRIRACNVSDFCGPWSSTVTATLSAPGISGADDGNGVLIFTSNQAPLVSLAYVKQFEREVVETFGFPEADFVELRAQYQRDFFTAFHGTERGGETFPALLLVQAAAIPPESLANFKNIRDLAWADLPYVCVRDELGNRWFANVRVPDGVVRMNRTLYFANIIITEVTSTPAPVTS